MLVFFRRLPRMDYVRPKSITEVFDVIDPAVPTKHQVYAGGTDLLLKLKSREIKAPAAVIDLKGIRDLDYVEWDAQQGLRIGAIATLASVIQSAVVNELSGARRGRQAHGVRPDPAPRHDRRQCLQRGALGELDTGAAGARAQVVCVSRSGERVLPLKDFFRGPGEVALCSPPSS